MPCPPAGCFPGATRITLADGSSKPIEQIEIGDRVHGRMGINTVFAVATPKLGDHRLYALNGSAFFVITSHPFLTEGGWKSIDPAATAIEHLGLPVTRPGTLFRSIIGQVARYRSNVRAKCPIFAKKRCP